MNPELSILGYNAVYFVKSQPTFRKNMARSGLKSKLSKESAQSRQQAELLNS
jgi:hypothetical protein